MQEGRKNIPPELKETKVIDPRAANWQLFKSEFEWDGSWRDFYIADTTVGDWQRLIDFLRTRAYELDFSVTGEKRDLPMEVTTLFEVGKQLTATLSVRSNITFCCHFFAESEIEFDIDPREVKNDETLQSLFQFMSDVGRALNKRIVMTPENMQESEIFSFDPKANQLQFHSTYQSFR